MKPVLQTVDITHCDKEPIHIPSSIQPHGFLLTLHPERLDILQFSANAAERCGYPKKDIQGITLFALLGEQGKVVESAVKKADISQSPSHVLTITIGADNASYNILAHQFDGVIILEFEEAHTDKTLTFSNLYPVVHAFTSQLQGLEKLDKIYDMTAKEVQRITGYGRVLIYRFDTDWHGVVVAECRKDKKFPSLEDHHFPASDIPKQARELYRLNRLRIIPDANYQPVPLTPVTNPISGKPLNMSYSALRSVSPVHVQYMKNMETLASMSISIMVGERLWGLIACHNHTPKHVPFEMRTACDFIGQFLSLHISNKEYISDYQYQIKLNSLNSELLVAMAAEPDLTTGLRKNKRELLAMADATGAAIISEGKVYLLGKTPGEKQVKSLISWLQERSNDEVFHTDHLSAVYPEAGAYKDIASGLLAISISKLHSSYILWFRPEVLQTIVWSGDPQKQITPDGFIHPRNSFATWKEVVSLKSYPWKEAEVNAAKELRNSVVGIVLRKAEELAELNEVLGKTNQELEEFSHTVSHDLRAPFRHIVGYSELIKEMEGDHLSERCQGFLDNVIESGRFAGQLVDNLLHFSQVGRLPIESVDIDMDLLVSEAINDLALERGNRNIDWQITALPKVKGDLFLLRLVWGNLIANAIKYTANKKLAIIQIGYDETETELIFYIKDNGIGFEMQYVDKLFGVFQRLHKMEDFEGTGIGLANVKRIITRHNGRVWAEGQPNKGATFYFTLPKNS